MRFKEGYLKTKPAIESIGFDERGKMSIFLKDGRIIIVPLVRFPSIKKLNVAQRKKFIIADDRVIIFENCDEVFHIEQFLGSEQIYHYSFAS